MKLSADRSVAEIRVNGRYNTEALDALIRELALLRADMTPAVAAHIDGLNSDHGVLVEDGQSASIRQRANGGFRLWLRHRGLGWLAWNLDARAARGMADFITHRTPGGPDIDLIGHQDAHRH